MPVSLTIQREVEFHETDAAGIVHFSKVAPWIEAAEKKLIESLDLQYFSDNGIQLTGFPKVSFSCNYRHPMQFNDKLTICLELKKTGKSSLHYTFNIHNADGLHCAGGELTSVWACFNRETKKLQTGEIPDSIRKQLLTK